MGQHLHIYTSAAVTFSEAQSWCDCRIKEYYEVPQLGFEATAERKVSDMMSRLSRANSFDTFEHWSTWATTIWPRLWWSAYVIDDAIIQNCRYDLEVAFVQLPKMPGHGEDWQHDHIFDWLIAKRGCVAWGNNDGI